MSASFSFIPPYMLQQVCDYYQRKMDEDVDRQPVFNATGAAAATAQPDRKAAVAELTWKEKYERQKAAIQFLYQQSSQPVFTNPNQPVTSTSLRANMKVYDLSSGEPVEKSEADGKKSHDVLCAFTSLKAINALYADTIGRNVFLGKEPKNTMRIFLNSDDTSAFNNAFWLPETSSVYFGHVDTTLFNPFIEHLDIVAHEFTHGFTQYSSNLVYEGQSGALNESISDAFGSAAMQLQLKQENADDATWLIADKILVPHSGSGRAIRSMKAPGTAFTNHPQMGNDPQPNHMNQYKQTKEDNGGVHLNSGIPNRAFYLTTTGLQGPSYDKPIKIWHAAAVATKANATFMDFAMTTAAKAKSLYGANEESLVKKAWYDVGVLQQGPQKSSFFQSDTVKYSTIIGIVAIGAFVTWNFSSWKKHFTT